MNSFMGKVLRVDLSTGRREEQKIPPAVYEAVLGGKGLEAWYPYNKIPAGADPLGPENILALAPGALCGTGVLRLYKRTLNGFVLIDEVEATGIGCEYGEYDPE